MKLFFFLILSAIVVAGCNKSGDVAPKNNNGKSSKTTGDGSSQTAPDTTPKLTHDDSIHMAAFKVNPQAVKTSVSGTKLILIFNENADLLFSVEGYQKTSAIHLLENFQKTLLAGFDFTTVAEDGNITSDWVDDNLNNVKMKSVTGTIVNNIKMVKINVHRPFTFSKVYSSNQAALNEQSLFVNKTDDTVSFSSYCYYNQKKYLPSSFSARLVYSK